MAQGLALAYRQSRSTTSPLRTKRRRAAAACGRARSSRPGTGGIDTDHLNREDLLTFYRQSADPGQKGGPADGQPLSILVAPPSSRFIGLRRPAHRGRDGDAARASEVPVDDWIVDWFSPPRRRRSNRVCSSAGRNHAGPLIEPLIIPEPHALPFDAGINLIEQACLVSLGRSTDSVATASRTNRSATGGEGSRRARRARWPVGRRLLWDRSWPARRHS